MKSLASLTRLWVHLPPAETAIIFDWENWWALDSAECLELHNKRYIETIHRHYAPFWEQGVNVDVIDSEMDLQNIS